MPRRMTIAVVFALTLSGCATMNSEECALSDWHAVGYEDGAKGLQSERFGDYRKDCAKHGVVPDFQAYLAGRDEGLVEFCRPERGFRLGENGRAYNGVCDAALEAPFLDAYRVGKQLHTLRSRLSETRSRIASHENRIEDNAELIDEKEAALIAEDTTTEQRVLLLADLKRLAEEQGELRAEIDQLISEQAYREAELNDYESTLTGYRY
ncbi:MAG: DUF2799 domain-containing protein [Pseudomonadota bacterium]